MTLGPKYKLRNEIDINRVCTTLYQNLENDLKESLIEQAKAERLDGITMSNSGSNQRKEMRRLTPTASGHNATLHSYCTFKIEKLRSQCFDQPSPQ